MIEFQIRSELEDVVETLRSATSVNADIIGRPDLGRIAEESQADLVVFDGNPLDDPSLLWKGPRRVIQGGEVLRA